jgi:hypothetical protein
MGRARLVDEGPCHVMSESGLAKRDRRRVLRARGVADTAGCSDEVWPGRGGEYGGRGDSMTGNRRDLTVQVSSLLCGDSGGCDGS